jgi:hypothetical protein
MKCDRSNDTKKSAGCFTALFARRRRPNTTKRVNLKIFLHLNSVFKFRLECTINRIPRDKLCHAFLSVL